MIHIIPEKSKIFDEPALAAINDVNKQLTETKSIETKIQNLTDVSSGDQIREKAPVILEKLRCGPSRRSKIWENTSLDSIWQTLYNASAITKSFTCAELQILIEMFQIIG